LLVNFYEDEAGEHFRCRLLPKQQTNSDPTHVLCQSQKNARRLTSPPSQLLSQKATNALTDSIDGGRALMSDANSEQKKKIPAAARREAVEKEKEKKKKKEGKKFFFSPFFVIRRRMRRLPLLFFFFFFFLLPQ
jgi:hypothetical protein